MSAFSKRKIFYIYFFIVIFATAFISSQIVFNDFAAIYDPFNVKKTSPMFVNSREKHNFSCDELLSEDYPEKYAYGNCYFEGSYLCNATKNGSWSKEGFNIAFIGDSFTAGSGLEEGKNKAFPKKTWKTLDKKISENVSFVSYGVGGAEMKEKMRIFKNEVEKKEPDFLVLQVLSDDFHDRENMREPFRQFINEECSIRDFISREKLNRMEIRAYRLDSVPITSEILRENIMSPLFKIENLKEEDTRVILLILDPEPMRNLEVLEAVRYVGKKFNWTIVDSKDIYSNYSLSEVTVSSEDHHPSLLAHDLISNRLSRVIISINNK